MSLVRIHCLSQNFEEVRVLGWLFIMLLHQSMSYLKALFIGLLEMNLFLYD